MEIYEQDMLDFSISQSGEGSQVPLFTLEEFPELKREESPRQRQSNRNGNMSTKSKAKKTRKVQFASGQLVKSYDQGENAPRKPVILSWSEVSASQTMVAPSQPDPASDQRPAAPPKPDDAKKHPILKLLQREAIVEENHGDKNTGAIIMVSELEFHDALSTKEDTISALRQENAALLENMERLNSELRKMEAVQQQANERARQLETDLANERKKVQEVESLNQITKEVQAAPVHQHQEDQEKKALRDEVMKLTDLLENQQTEHEDVIAALYDQRIKTDKDRRDAIRRADQLKANLMAEKIKIKETEICLAEQMEETSRLRSALDEMERDLDEGRQQWELEKVRLLTNNQETSEVEQLKYQLQSQIIAHEDEIAALYNELVKRNNDHQDALRMVEQLKEKLKEEKNKVKEFEDSLTRQEAEKSNLQAALVQMERALRGPAAPMGAGKTLSYDQPTKR